VIRSIRTKTDKEIQNYCKLAAKLAMVDQGGLLASGLSSGPSLTTPLPSRRHQLTCMLS